jgi:tripartite-type tricarboxylate transporter receptor subunit TctC
MGSTSAVIIAPLVHKSAGFTAASFAPVAGLSETTEVLALHPSVPAKTVKEFIALAKARPGTITFGSAGQATSPHLSGELLKVLAKIDIVHVPFKGSGQSVISSLAGEIAANFPSVPTAIPYIKAGKLRGLGVTTAKRSQALPEVPSIAEAGVPGYEATQWFGVLAPAGTPRPIIDRLNQEIVKLLKSPDVRDRLIADGTDPAPTTPEEFAAYIKSETEKWTRVIKAAGIKPQ